MPVSFLAGALSGVLRTGVVPVIPAARLFAVARPGVAGCLVGVAVSSSLGGIFYSCTEVVRISYSYILGHAWV